MACRCFFLRDATADSRHQSKAAATTLEQLNHGGRLLSREEVGGAVRVKIVVSKRELKQMVAALGEGAGAVTAAVAAAGATSERHQQRATAAGSQAEATRSARRAA
jgi:hypothetical protein